MNSALLLLLFIISLPQSAPRPEPQRVVETQRVGYTIKCFTAGCEFDPERADKIYYYMAVAVAHEFSPDRPPRIMPSLKLQIGGCKSEGYYIIWGSALDACFDKWDEKKWALIVGIASSTQILSSERLIRALNTGFAVLDSSIDVKDLKNAPK